MATLNNITDSHIALEAGASGVVTQSLHASRNGISQLTVYLKASSGDMTGANLMAQFSPNNVDWYNSVHESGVITSNDNWSFQVNTCGASYVRLKVKTNSTIASNISIDVDGV